MSSFRARPLLPANRAISPTVLGTQGRTIYILLSSDSDLNLFGTLIAQAGFVARLVAEHSIVIETFLIYELQPV